MSYRLRLLRGSWAEPARLQPVGQATQSARGCQARLAPRRLSRGARGGLHH